MKETLKKLFNKGSEKVEYTAEELVLREKIEKEFYFKAVWGIIGTAIFLLILFFIVFFRSLEGEEDTKVPNLQGLKLADAIIKLQDKALYPKLSVKNSSPNEKGLIINQEISPGSVVKAGRLIGLTVSLGGVIDSVGSYEGQTLQAVEAELKKLFTSSSYDPLLIINKPIEIVSDEPEGTIISQDPPPGTVISDVTKITFHVSKGKLESSYIVPTMKGLSFQDGLKKISQWPIRYRFNVRPKRNSENAGFIVNQLPPTGETVPWSTIVEMTMTTPENYPSNYTFGLMEIVVPTYHISIPMKLERVNKDGETELLVESRTFGGPITIPYLEEVGVRLIVTVDDKEIQSFTVRQQ